METNIIHTALDNLKKNTGIAGVVIAREGKGIDAEVEFQFENGKELFVVEVKREIRNHQLDKIKQMAEKNRNFLLIANTIFPKIKEELRKEGIAYLDAAGNIFLKTAKTNIWIEGHKKEKTEKEKINRAFTATGLRVIYLFLIDNELVNETQRRIAEEAGIALGNINYIINGLREQEFLIEKGKKQYQLINKNNLLEKWTGAYEEKLKPALYIGNFRFAKAEDEKNWKQLLLKPEQTFWGGEPAGDLITQYLAPEIFTLYTEETRNELIKNYRIVPANEGNIKVYNKFWKDRETFNETIVHPLLAYTDLMNTGNSRCIETAKLIYDRYLKESI
ncbi:MAG: hypothetical protein GXX85_17430 [Ignavibacteria bacterium]|nr:hypothetical protein [Ignavibacteria bacterium]